jgi:uncharacterized protein (DUF302 family)
MRTWKSVFVAIIIVLGAGALVAKNPLDSEQHRRTDMPEPSSTDALPQTGDAGSAPGIAKVPSPRNTAKTVERFEAILKEKGIHLFARVDHAEGAAKVKLALRPTALLIFGNPQVGTPLMQSQQTIGIDLPLRVLVFEDEKGKTWVAYNDPAYLAKRHGINDRGETVKAMTAALKSLAEAATAP